MYSKQNQFNLTQDLAETLSEIISDEEKSDIICTKITLSTSDTSQELEDKNLDNINFWGSNLQSLASIQNSQDNQVSSKIITENTYTYLIVMENKVKHILQDLQKITFKNKEEILNFLNQFCYLAEEYHNIFNAEIFFQDFPYLRTFFEAIDNWREATNSFETEKNILSLIKKIYYKKF